MLSHSKGGFTVIEVLLVISLMAIAAGVALPAGRHLLVRNDLATSTITLRQTMRRAQHLADSNSHDSDWGVRAEAGRVVLFKGATYSTRDTDFDEVYEISNSLIIGGDQEVVFSRVDAATVPASTTLTTSLGATNTVRVSSVGVVE